MLAAAPVQPVGDVALARAVLLHVRVEHQERDPADPGDPDHRVRRAAAGQVQGDPGGLAVGLAQQRQRQFVGVEHGIVLLLPAVAREGLAEVAVPVEEADPDQRYAEVARGFEVVAA